MSHVMTLHQQDVLTLLFEDQTELTVRCTSPEPYAFRAQELVDKLSAHWLRTDGSVDALCVFLKVLQVPLTPVRIGPDGGAQRYL